MLPLSLLQWTENKDGMDTESHFILNTTKHISKDSETDGMIKPSQFPLPKDQDSSY